HGGARRRCEAAHPPRPPADAPPGGRREGPRPGDRPRERRAREPHAAVGCDVRRARGRSQSERRAARDPAGRLRAAGAARRRGVPGGLVGEARGFEDRLAYSGRLEETAGFANVLLGSHELKAEATGQAVAFTLTADWVGRP